MAKRGRPSAAELAIIGPAGVATMRRPEAPAGLSDEMRDEWRRIVNAHPADWFMAGAASVLAQLVRHIVAARRCSQLILQAERAATFDVAQWDGLLRAQERQSNLIASLATRLRLTPQSRYAPGTAARRAGEPAADVRRPWEPPEDAEDA